MDIVSQSLRQSRKEKQGRRYAGRPGPTFQLYGETNTDRSPRQRPSNQGRFCLKRNLGKKVMASSRNGPVRLKLTGWRPLDC